MGSFSWLKADNETQVANIVDGRPFRMLIPAQFGGGSIKDHYRDYGDLCEPTHEQKNQGFDARYDIYEILAFWNADTPYKEGKVRDYLQYDSDTNWNIPEKSRYTDHNRRIGIGIGCYKDDIDKLPFPLKLVSASYKGTYEDCNGRSYGDPEQGWRAIPRNK